LRHICAAASALAGGVAKKKGVAAVAEEITSLCARKLEQIGAQRGWGGVPRVMNLDLGSSC
jgi:hypothetical protein